MSDTTDARVARDPDDPADPAQIAGYLDRIGYRDSPSELLPTGELLSALHLSHLYAVPFENLDIPLGRRIELDLAELYGKIVTRRRGGFCYELNGLFAWLLESLGFKLRRLSARVFGDDGPGPDFDHMLLLVELDEPRIADVGFGDSFLEPLPLHTAPVQQGGCDYRLREEGDTWTLDQRQRGKDWAPQYVFTLDNHALSDFSPMCEFQQTSPSSPFTRKSVCSRATPEGRITLANGRLIVTSDVRREERDVRDLGDYRALLWAHFGFNPGDSRHGDRLLRKHADWAPPAADR